MAFQLFNSNINQNAIGEGIASIGQGINKAAEMGEQYQADYKAMVALSKSHPELTQAMGFDPLSSSPVQASRAFRGYVQYAQLGKQAAEQAEMEARAQKYQTEGQATKYALERLMKLDGAGGEKTQSIFNTQMGEELAAQDQAASASYQDLKTLKLDKEYEDFKKAYITASGFQNRANKLYADREQMNSLVAKGIIPETAIPGIQSETGGAPEMTADEKKSLVLLHKVNSNPTKARAYMELMRAQQSGVNINNFVPPSLQSPDMVAVTEHIKAGGTTATLKKPGTFIDNR